MKRTLALLIALLLCLSLAACGQPAAETSEPPAQTEAPAPTEAGGEDAEPEALSGTLEIWSSGEELGRFVEGFNAIYPDVTVNITVVPNADFIAKLSPALAAGEGEEVLAGQNPFAFYNEQMAKLPDDLMTAYDGTINTAFLAATKSYATGVMTKDEAIAQFKADVANAYPELVIE